MSESVIIALCGPSYRYTHSSLGQDVYLEQAHSLVAIVLQTDSS